MDKDLQEQTIILAEFMGWVQSSTNKHLYKPMFNVADDIYYKISKFSFGKGMLGVDGGSFSLPQPKFGCRIISMHYHTSFDWFMPVYLKIKEVSYGTNLLDTLLYESLREAILEGDILRAFKLAHQSILLINNIKTR